MKALLKNFGAENIFVPKNLDGGYDSTKYTNIKSEYVGNLAKIKLLEAGIMAYDTKDPFIIPTLVDEYASEVEDSWVNHVVTGFYLLYHWSNILLCVVA